MLSYLLCPTVILVLPCTKASTIGVSAAFFSFGRDNSERVVGQCPLCSAAGYDGLVSYEGYVQRNCVWKGQKREEVRTVMSIINAESPTCCTKNGKITRLFTGHGSI